MALIVPLQPAYQCWSANGKTLFFPTSIRLIMIVEKFTPIEALQYHSACLLEIIKDNPHIDEWQEASIEILVIKVLQELPSTKKHSLVNASSPKSALSAPNCSTQIETTSHVVRQAEPSKTSDKKRKRLGKSPCDTGVPLRKKRLTWDELLTQPERPNNTDCRSHTKCNTATELFQALKNEGESFSKDWTVLLLSAIVGLIIGIHAQDPIIDILERVWISPESCNGNTIVGGLSLLLLVEDFQSFRRDDSELKSCNLKTYSSKFSKQEVVKKCVQQGIKVWALQSHLSGAGMLAVQAKDKFNRLRNDDLLCLVELMKSDDGIRNRLPPQPEIDEALNNLREWTDGDGQPLTNLTSAKTCW